MGIRRHIAFVVLAVLVTVFLLPVPAHAGFLDVLGKTSESLGSIFLDVGSVMLDTLSNLLVDALKFLGNNLQSVLEWQTTYGGATVYQMWKWLRDLCNMLFIVVLVAIAFGTIFDTLKPTGFHARQSLALFVAAAILINLSLAVGQTIVWTGNQATELVLEFMPDNVGAQVATSLQAIGVAAGTAGGIPVTAPQTSGVPLDQLTPQQRIIIEAWGTRATEDTNEGAAARIGLTSLQSCLAANQLPVDQCYRQAAKAKTDAVYAALEKNQSIIQRLGNVVNETAFRLWTDSATVDVYNRATAAVSSNDVEASLSQFGNLLVRFFLLMVLTLSFLAITLFMVIRIPIIWFLLALSATAFFALAVPPAREQFFKWLKNIIGISFFGPLYLMVIYIGLFVLNTQGSLVSSGNNINDLPLISTLFGTAFFYIVAAAIFVGGAAAVMKIAFGLSPAAGSIFGAIGGRLGVSEQTGFGIRTVGRGVGFVTGAPTIARGLRRGAEERYKRVVSAPLARRGERLEAGARTLIEGGKARQAYLQGRIDDRTKRLDQQLQKQTDRAIRKLEQVQATIVQAEARVALEAVKKDNVSAIERANKELDRVKAQRDTAEQGMEQLKKKQEEKLRDMLQGVQAIGVGRVRGRVPVSNETAVAAGNQLMKLQKITAEELANLQQRYAKISPAASQGFIKQRNEQLQKDAKTRKYTDSDEMKQFLQLITDKKEAGRFIDAAKGSKKNKFPALVAGGELQLIMGPDGKTPLSVEEVIQREARDFKAIDMLKAEKHYHDTLGENWRSREDGHLKAMDERYNRLLRQAKSYGDMIANASGEQLERIKAAKDSAYNEVADVEDTIRDLKKKLREMDRRTYTNDDERKNTMRPIQSELASVEQRKRDLTREEREPERREEISAPKAPEQKKPEEKKP